MAAWTAQAKNPMKAAKSTPRKFGHTKISENDIRLQT